MGEEIDDGESDHLDNLPNHVSPPEIVVEPPADLRTIRDHFQVGIEMLDELIGEADEVEPDDGESDVVDDINFKKEVLYLI